MAFVSLKSLSSKLYLAIAALPLGLWTFDVSGGTIATVVLVAFMLSIHAGGHGGHGGGGGHGGHGSSTPTPGAEQGSRLTAAGSGGGRGPQASQPAAPDRAAPEQPRSGCH